MSITCEQEYLRVLSKNKKMEGLGLKETSDYIKNYDLMKKYDERYGYDKKVGPWIPTYTGKRFWILDPHPDAIDIEHIAYTLSRINRFLGITKGEPYSVGQHCVEGAKIIPQKYKLAYLLHDGGEAYTGDIITPVKQQLGDTVYNIEHPIISCIFQKFNLDFSLYTDGTVKHYDLLMQKMEDEFLTEYKIRNDIEFKTDMFWPTPWKQTKDNYLKKFGELYGQKQ